MVSIFFLKIFLFSADFRLKIFYVLFLNYSLWHFRSRIYWGIDCSYCRFFRFVGLFCRFEKGISFIIYNCIVFTNFQHTKLSSFENLSLGYVLKILLKSHKFRPRYSYKIKKGGGGGGRVASETSLVNARLTGDKGVNLTAFCLNTLWFGFYGLLRIFSIPPSFVEC